MKTRTTPFDLAALKARWMSDPVFKAAFEAELLECWRIELLTLLLRQHAELLLQHWLDEDGPRYPQEDEPPKWIYDPNTRQWLCHPAQLMAVEAFKREKRR